MLRKIVSYAYENDCSDIHLTWELPPVFRQSGHLVKGPFPPAGEYLIQIIEEITTPKQRQRFEELEELDFSYVFEGDQRCRVNVYRQNGHPAIAMRVLRGSIPSMDELGLPLAVQRLANEPRGLILVTGPTGSGKSTTLASMIDFINTNKKQHIITLEDPVEYIHHHKSSIIHQRELGRDVRSFSDGLRSALREDPDVILVGEMRDLETISAAVTAAETGHLVLSTLHTMGASATVDRIIDVFPPHSQGQIRTQLAMVLKGIVSQQLIPHSSGQGRRGAFEILLSTDAAMHMIRDNKAHQLRSVMQTGAKDGMCTLDASLARLVRAGEISMEDALSRASNRFELVELIQQ